MYDPDNPVPTWTVTTMQRVATEPTLAAAALRYANLGVPVFPCVPGGKQPLTPNGFHDATSHARSIHAWWERYPDANLGLPTGARTGLVVVDVDVHGDTSGFGSFEQARSAGLAEGWGWMVRTPSGGVHAYYPTGADDEQRCWQVPSAHVDFRGDGGYVIAPPSRFVIDGKTKTYDVLAVSTRRAQPIDATALRRFLEPPRRRLPFAAPQFDGIGCHPEALARTVASAPHGGRNRTLFWASCRMVESQHSHDAVVSVLMPAAQRAGLPDREIEITIESAVRIASRLGPGSGLGPTRSEAIQL